MKFKATWRSESCSVLATAVSAVLRDSGSDKATIKFSKDRYVGFLLRMYNVLDSTLHRWVSERISQSRGLSLTVCMHSVWLSVKACAMERSM